MLCTLLYPVVRALDRRDAWCGCVLDHCHWHVRESVQSDRHRRRISLSATMSARFPRSRPPPKAYTQPQLTFLKRSVRHPAPLQGHLIVSSVFSPSTSDAPSAQSEVTRKNSPSSERQSLSTVLDSQKMPILERMQTPGSERSVSQARSHALPVPNVPNSNFTTGSRTRSEGTGERRRGNPGPLERRRRKVP